MDALLAVPLAVIYGVVAGLLLLAALAVWSRATFVAIQRRSPIWKVFTAALSSAGFWVVVVVLGLSYYSLFETQSYWVLWSYVGVALATVLIGATAVHLDHRRHRHNDGESGDNSA